MKFVKNKEIDGHLDRMNAKFLVFDETVLAEASMSLNFLFMETWELFFWQLGR